MPSSHCNIDAGAWAGAQGRRALGPPMVLNTPTPMVWLLRFGFPGSGGDGCLVEEGCGILLLRFGPCGLVEGMRRMWLGMRRLALQAAT